MIQDKFEIQATLGDCVFDLYQQASDDTSSLYQEVVTWIKDTLFEIGNAECALVQEINHI